jgi:hypothetical protein
VPLVVQSSSKRVVMRLQIDQRKVETAYKFHGTGILSANAFYSYCMWQFMSVLLPSMTICHVNPVICSLQLLSMGWRLNSLFEEVEHGPSFWPLMLLAAALAQCLVAHMHCHLQRSLALLPRSN